MAKEEIKQLSEEFLYILYNSALELIPLSFDNPIKVLYHLKQTGVTGISSGQAVSSHQQNNGSLLQGEQMPTFCRYIDGKGKR